MTPTPPRIFDRAARERRFERLAASAGPVGDFHRRVTEDVLERIDAVTRPLPRVLLVNPPDPALAEALRERGSAVTAVRAQEDEPGLPGGFDAVVSPAGLDTVDDLPGALALLRRALRPDGLLLASFPGAGSFAAARAAALEADLAVSGSAQARFHPLVDVRSLGDLAARAGLVLPVAEVDGVNLAYRSLGRLFEDLRDHGWHSVLAGSRRPVSRAWMAASEAAFIERADESGRVVERLNLLTLTAWSSGPDQPRPAPRGSATASLTTVLRRGEAGSGDGG